MKKIIVLVMTCLMLTSCVNESSIKQSSAILQGEVQTSRGFKSGTTYINDDIKENIEEINTLRDKYKDSLDEDEFNSVYIDIYDKENRNRSTQDVFDFYNRSGVVEEEYFNDLVQILDKREAVGLKDYINEVDKMDFDENDILVKKIGRAVVYVERMGPYSQKKHIFIRVKLSDIKDENFRDTFDKISEGKYILNNVFTEGKLEPPIVDPLSRDLISFENDELFMKSLDSSQYTKFASVRYELLLKDKEIDKVNILLSRRNDEKLKTEDIEVFINLLNVLDIEEADRGKLLKAYRNIFQEKIDKSALDIEGYSIYVKYNKGNNYIGDKKENIYISIERDK